MLKHKPSKHKLRNKLNTSDTTNENSRLGLFTSTKQKSKSQNRKSKRRRNQKNKDWAYDSKDLIGILADSARRSRPIVGDVGKSRTTSPSSPYFHPHTPENRDLITGNNFFLTLDYLNTLLVETLEKYRVIWKYRRVNNYFIKSASDEEITALNYILQNMEDYYIQSVMREFNCLVEEWLLKDAIPIMQAEEINNLIYSIRSRMNENEMAQKEVTNSYASLSQKRVETCHAGEILRNYFFKSIDFWGTKVEMVQKQILHSYVQYGSIIVPKTYKLHIPCSDDIVMGELEIGFNVQGIPQAVKHVYSRCDKILLAKTISKLKKIRHVNLLPYYLSPGPHCVVATPLMNANLGQLMMHLKHVNRVQDDALFLVRQLFNGVCFLHTNIPSIVHGNLKPTNVFVDGSGTLKIAEFGLKQAPIRLATDLIWSSPDQIQTYLSNKTTECSLPGDIASTATLMHFILSGGQHPYGEQVDDILKNMASGKLMMRVQDEAAIDLMTKMLANKPKERLNINESLGHIFWWPFKKKWTLVQTCSNRSSHDAILVQHCLKDIINKPTPDEVNQPHHYHQELKKCINNWLEEIRLLFFNSNSLVRLQQQSPALPTYLYQLLQITPWKSHPFLKSFFITSSTHLTKTD